MSIQTSDTFGLQWTQHARTQLDSVSGVPISRTRFFAATGWPEAMAGEHILEAGCGAGRFTEVLLATGATIVACDASSAAVAVNRANNGAHERLRLVVADILALPDDLGQFDRVCCLGVLQHTRDPAAAFAALAARVRPGGALAIDVYKKTLSALCHWKYLLRPLTTRLSPEVLYSAIAAVVPLLVPAVRWTTRTVGAWSGRIFPVATPGNLTVPREAWADWAILDTFDMYAPPHDHPQTLATVRQWFADAGFCDVVVQYGPNGIIGCGTKTV